MAGLQRTRRERWLLAFLQSRAHPLRTGHKSQRAVVAARIANLEHGQRTESRKFAELAPLTQTQAAALLNVSERSVQDVKRLERER